MVGRTFTVLLAVLLMPTSSPAGAQTATEPIRYSLSFPAPQTNYVEVSAVVPTDSRPSVELMMAVWTPGSYLVREYSRNVESVTAAAADGRPVAVEKSDKNRWRVATGGAPSVTVKYRVYAHEMSVRTNWVEADFALINGAPTFLTLVGGGRRPHEVAIEPARGWQTSMTSLAGVAGASHRYRAADYDELVDSPIVVGNPAVYEFSLDEKKHYLVNIGEAGLFDGPRAAKDFEAIVREQRRFWGALPYERYVLINLLTAVPGQIAGGGLEHRNSAVVIGNRWATRNRQSYFGWLEFVSHELFHAWNGKRLRPTELGPFDYENENLTESLWIVEGVTDYYAELLVHRAGFSSQVEYLDALSNKIEEVQGTPGRAVQSASLASQDAWIKFYRPDENTTNSSVSYYAKGYVLGFVLDAKIRKASNGVRSLDDVLRAAYQKFSAGKGYTPAEFRAVTEQVAGISLGSLWDGAVDGTAELDYTEALDLLGLRFRPVDPVRPDRPGRAWLGANTRNDAGRLVVSQVRRDGPASAAGLNVDDEIIAIDEIRVRADQLTPRLDQYRPGDRVKLLVARREQLMTIELAFGVEPARQWRLEVNPAAGAAQRLRDQWLKPQT